MRFRLLTALAILPLSACVLPPPAISDFNGDSVKLAWMDIRSMTGPTKDGYKAQLDAEAARVCAMRKRKAEFASVRTLPSYQAEYLYLCN